MFVNATSASGGGDTSYGHGVCVGDFNADGFDDMFVAGYRGSRLLVNNGDGTFSDATDDPIRLAEHWSTCAIWLDVNRDGLLDLCVLNYVDWTPESS